MQKLDRRSWKYGNTYAAFGCELGFRANTAEALEEISEHVPAWIKPSSAPEVDRMLSYIKGDQDGRLRYFNLLYFDHALAAKSHQFSVIRDRFADGMEIAIAEKAQDRILLHAGAVSWEGKGILIPGRSHSGKTTLVTQLLRLGASYFSDEYAVVDQYGNVEPLDRPLHIRMPNSGERKIVPPAAFGAQTGRRSVPISLVVFTEYKENAQIKPETISAGETILGLMSNTFTAHNQPEKTLDSIEVIASKAHIVKSERGDAVSTAQKIVKLLERKQ